MEKVVGPVDGYYAAIFACELDGKFRASFKVCAAAPADYRSAYPVRHARVDGVSDTPAQAFEIAEQLARRQIARLRDGDETSLQGGSGTLYAATEPCPLYAATEPAPLYAATEPCPLYEVRGDRAGPSGRSKRTY